MEARELLKWNRALDNYVLVKKETLDEAYLPARLNDGSTFPYGFGWGIGQTMDSVKTLHHTGGWPGYNTLNWRAPEKGWNVIVLSNQGDAKIWQSLTEILQAKD